MFKHIKGKPLTIEELQAADRMLANGWEQGWIERYMIADEIRSHQAMLKAAREPQRKLQFQQQ